MTQKRMEKKLNKNLRAAAIAGGSILFLAGVFAVIGFKPTFSVNEQDIIGPSEPIPEPVLAPPKNIPEKVIIAVPEPKPQEKIQSLKPIAKKPIQIKQAPTGIESKVAEIESRVPAKPRTPKEAVQYSQIVWGVARSLSKLDPVKSRKWIDEGMQFSDDPAYHALSAVLYYRSGDYQSAKMSAESAMKAKSSSYMSEYRILSEAVVTVVDARKGVGNALPDSVSAESIIGRF